VCQYDPVKDLRLDPSKHYWTPYHLTDLKWHKFSIHYKKSCVSEEEASLRGNGEFDIMNMISPTLKSLKIINIDEYFFKSGEYLNSETIPR